MREWAQMSERRRTWNGDAYKDTYEDEGVVGDVTGEVVMDATVDMVMDAKAKTMTNMKGVISCCEGGVFIMRYCCCLFGFIFINNMHLMKLF